MYGRGRQIISKTKFYDSTIPYMKKTGLLFCLLSTLAIGVSFTKSRETRIANGVISVRMLLPDKDSGYYRGSRFDWSGVIAELEWNGHSYFGQWFEKYNPTNHDAILGPVEAFDPIGFEQAKPGENFIKIGVGAVTKTNESPYDFLKYYNISNYGKWDVQTSSGQVQFRHRLKDKSYAYDYKKIVKLSKNKAQLILSHFLKNTGKERIETKVYDHNFFVIDNQPTGPDFVVTFPFELTGSAPNEFVKFSGNELVFLKELGRRNVSFKDLTNGKPANYDLRIENRRTKAGVRITSDRPISKLVFWAAGKTLCPEPYIDIGINPGQEFTWTITYDYYTAVAE